MAMKQGPLALALCMLALSATPCLAQVGPAAPTGPLKPGAVRVTTRAPDLDKWVLRAGTNGSRVYVCKPLACPDPASVTFSFSKSPTRNPDPKALDRYAKIEMPRQTRALAAAEAVLSAGKVKVDTVSSNTAKLKGYPGVLNETKISDGKVELHLQIAIIFAGPVMIRVSARSVNAELAGKSLSEFIDAMTIVEGAPLVSPVTPRAPADGSQSL